jgi:ammonium transporter Rh
LEPQRLWIFWPSFCAALVPVELIPLVAINTILALCGATIATYALSTLIRGRIEVGDIANASLAGGVAIGAAVANITPGWSMLIGIVAGAISVIGYTFIQPRLQKLTGGVDTCGVHNLHGLPGIFGGITAVLLVSLPIWQFAGIVTTVIIAVTMGLIVGFIASRLGRKLTPYDDMDEFCPFEINKQEKDYSDIWVEPTPLKNLATSDSEATKQPTNSALPVAKGPLN